MNPNNLSIGIRVMKKIVILVVCTVLQVSEMSHAATTTTAENINREHRIELNSFGVKGDGITDDAAVVQKAVNSLKSGDTLAFSGTLLINNQISITTDNVILDFGNAIVLNTSAIKKTIWEHQSINPVFLISASNVHCRGGWFKNFVSQGLFAGGNFTGNGATGNTTSNITFKNMRFSGLSSSIESKCIQTRHVDNIVIEGILAENIGVDRADHYCETLSVNYCINAKILNSTVNKMSEGGAANYLYVDDGIITNNQFTHIGNTLYSIPLSMHVKYSNKIVVSDNIITMSSGGMAMKISEYTDNIVITGNSITVSGPQAKMYAGIYFQGASNFKLTDNAITYGGGRAIYVGPHTKVNSRNGVISDNKITTTYGVGDTKVKGSGIQVVGGNIGSDRQPIVISGNVFYESDVYVFQALNSVISNNTFINTTALAVTNRSYGGRAVFSASSSIFVENGNYNIIEGNKIINKETAPSGNRTGIRILATSNSSATRNIINFSSRTTSSYGMYSETSTYSLFDKNTVTNAIPTNITQ